MNAKANLPTKGRSDAASESDNMESFDLNMFDVESRDMPSIGTSGFEIASLLVALIILLGILYKH
ncbi:hypothetical protein ACAW74_14810 [Fibrella sp. WM1]|uniref:hypothetical protein n=1 Tax=Fibrella musci TaxID=3242485 RepID=UPI0035229B5E